MKNWTNIEELGASAHARRPKPVGNEPLIDEGLTAWRAASPRDLGCQATDFRSFASWKKMTGDFVAECLRFPASQDIAPPRLLESTDCGKTIREEWDIPVTPPLRAKATVFRPTGKPGPLPALLALHSMGGLRIFGRHKFFATDNEPTFLQECRRDCYDGISLLEEWAGRGCVTMAIDALGFGERTREAASQPETFDAWRRGCSSEEAAAFDQRASLQDEPTLVRQVESCGAVWAGLIVSDDRRCLDFLAAREDVDATRLGCFGLSYGAFRTNYLAALDERIRAAVSVCWMSTLDGQLGYNTRGSLGWFMTANPLFSRLDIPDLGALAAPRAFMALSGLDDIMLQPFGITDAHQHLRKAYIAAGCPEKLGSLILPGGHHFQVERQAAAWSFLARHLGMAQSGLEKSANDLSHG